MGRYKLPTNCKLLVPPQINKEVQPCLPKVRNDQDTFMAALQLQLAHGLAAIGIVMYRILPVFQIRLTI